MVRVTIAYSKPLLKPFYEIANMNFTIFVVIPSEPINIIILKLAFIKNPASFDPKSTPPIHFVIVDFSFINSTFRIYYDPFSTEPTFQYLLDHFIQLALNHHTIPHINTAIANRFKCIFLLIELKLICFYFFNLLTLIQI